MDRNIATLALVQPEINSRSLRRLIPILAGVHDINLQSVKIDLRLRKLCSFVRIDFEFCKLLELNSHKLRSLLELISKHHFSQFVQAEIDFIVRKVYRIDFLQRS